ncbi:MAG TPA: periplasmic heavy metal sensor [Terriglobales bacterium]|nr:periplasmic heavy metal sensor [Terriglobales bacterium]
MTKKIWAMVAAAVVLVGSAGAVAVARYGRGHMGRGEMGFMGERSLAQIEVRLKLSPEQSKQLRGLMAGRRQKMREQLQASQVDRRALMQEIFKDNPSQEEIQKRLSAIQERQATAMNDMVQAGLEFNKSLTPEQRAELNKMLAERFEVADRMHQRMQERMQQRPRHGQGPGGPGGPPPAPQQPQ